MSVSLVQVPYRSITYRNAVPTLPLLSLPTIPIGLLVGAAGTGSKPVRVKELVDMTLASEPERARRLR